MTLHASKALNFLVLYVWNGKGRNSSEREEIPQISRRNGGCFMLE